MSQDTKFIDVNQNEALKNLVIVLGITILLVTGVIGAGLIISRISAPQQDSQEIVTSGTTVREPDITINADGELTSPNESTETTTNEDTQFLNAEDIVFDVEGDGEAKILATEQTQPETIVQVVTPGDNYSWLSRRAMYKYMGEQKVGLNIGERLYFEVTLTKAVATSPLEVGDKVAFQKSKLSEIFKEASNLDSTTRLAWTQLAQNSAYI